MVRKDVESFRFRTARILSGMTRWGLLDYEFAFVAFLVTEITDSELTCFGYRLSTVGVSRWSANFQFTLQRVDFVAERLDHFGSLVSRDEVRNM